MMLHSGMKKADAQAARGALDNRKARIVVCVDMLGEGFDMPELKIAAFHDLRKSPPSRCSWPAASHDPEGRPGRSRLHRKYC